MPDLGGRGFFLPFLTVDGSGNSSYCRRRNRVDLGWISFLPTRALRNDDPLYVEKIPINGYSYNNIINTNPIKAMAAINAGHKNQKHLERQFTKASHAFRGTLSMARHTYFVAKDEIH